MATQSADQYRARATQARRIADNMQDRNAQMGLRDMASALEDEANRLESDETPSAVPPPATES